MPDFDKVKREMGLEELNTLKMMISNWRRGYESWLTPGDNDYVFEDFIEDVNLQMMPYVRRLTSTDYWTEEDVAELTAHVMKELNCLKGVADALRSKTRDSG